ATPEVVSRHDSADGTRKWLLKAEAGQAFEMVFIPETDRGTLCISSQVGCTLTCSFCHTGTQRLVRNLTAAEIVAQVMIARDRLGDWPGATRPTDGLVPDADRAVSNIVLMGMGEPLYNFDGVRDAMATVMDGDGLSLSRRRITLSTSGVVPMIPRAGDEIGSMLAISLHAVRDDLRNELVPLNRKYPIRDLLEASQGVSHSLSLDLYEQWAYMQKSGQFRYTPPTHILVAFAQALEQHKAEGGAPGRLARYKKTAKAMRDGMRRIGLSPLLGDNETGPIIQTFATPRDPNFEFTRFYEGLKQRGFIIYPGKLTKKPSFRVGNMGALDHEVMAMLVDATEATLKAMNVKDLTPAE
ncbi:MAG: radical SAM protein, partial [Gammaproteobacteria bacterium]|nr:radical SAM protein [Gammaproteobacteria bacterium]